MYFVKNRADFEYLGIIGVRTAHSSLKVSFSRIFLTEKNFKTSFV